MGADLYLGKECEVARKYVQPLFDAAVKLRDSYPRESVENGVAQKLVTAAHDAMYPEGSYFRDSYNSTSVLNTLGLSWWKDCGNLLNKAGNLSGDKLVLFRKMVYQAKQSLPSKEDLIAGHAQVDDEGQNSVASWHKMYQDKRERLLKFLDRAIKERKTIRCSL